MRRFTVMKAPFGSVGFVVTPRGLAHLFLMKSPPVWVRSILARRFADARYDRDLYPELRKQLEEYFAGRRVSFRVKTDLSGLGPFQKTVLEACARIASGQTLTYGQLARKIGRPRAARAVGGALARNPVPLVIPCHRVIAGNGSLGGFSAEQGVSLKRWLLDLEAGESRKILE